MTRQLEIVQEIYAAFGKGDVPAILERLSPDVAWELWPDNFGQRAGVPWLALRHGHEGVAEFFASLQALEFEHFEVTNLLVGKDLIAATISLEATSRRTGIRFEEEEIHLWSFGFDGLITRFRHYADTAKHMAAAGVWPAAPPTPRG